MSVSTVVAIQTQGRYSTAVDRWVYTYRVEYSQDCATFNKLLDANGNNQVRRFLIFLKVLLPSYQTKCQACQILRLISF